MTETSECHPGIDLYQNDLVEELPEDWMASLGEGWENVFEHLRSIGVGEICGLTRLEISLLPDSEMARIHGAFLDDATTTDVITFSHGEILIGVEVAKRQSVDFQSSHFEEIALYGIHGMLHLAGYDDREERDARAMNDRQLGLLSEFFGKDHDPTISN